MNKHKLNQNYYYYSPEIASNPSPSSWKSSSTSPITLKHEKRKKAPSAKRDLSGPSILSWLPWYSNLPRRPGISGNESNATIICIISTLAQSLRVTILSRDRVLSTHVGRQAGIRNRPRWLRKARVFYSNCGMANEGRKK